MTNISAAVMKNQQKSNNKLRGKKTVVLHFWLEVESIFIVFRIQELTITLLIYNGFGFWILTTRLILSYRIFNHNYCNITIFFVKQLHRQLDIHTVCIHTEYYILWDYTISNMISTLFILKYHILFVFQARLCCSMTVWIMLMMTHV